MAVLTRRASDVRINEVNFSQTLSQSANAIASLVVVSGKGPVGPKFYTDPAQFRADFGDAKASVSFDHYCAIDYFREGNGLWATRALESDARWAGLVVLVNAAGATVIRPISAGLSQIELGLPNWAGYVASGETALYVLYPKQGAGSYANTYALALQSYNLSAPTGVTGTGVPATSGILGAGTYTYTISAVSNTGAESLASSPATVIISSAPGVNNVQLTWSTVPGAVSYKIYGRTSTLSSQGLIATVGTSTLAFTDDGYTVASATKQPILSVSGLSSSSTGFKLSVYDLSLSTSTALENFNCTTDENVDETGGQTETTQRINPFSQYFQVLSNVPSLVTIPRLSSVSTPVATGGGTSGSSPTIATINNSWNLFLNKSKYVIDTMINAGRAVPAIQLNMDTIAQTRAECIAFLDTPSSQQTFSAAIDYRNVSLNLNSSYSALFCPDLLESDPVNGKFLFVPPSGAMAALFARTSRVGQPWYSMAGLNRGLLKVLDVRYTYDDGQSTQLYNAQVNYMRKFLGAGIPLWEQSTLASQSSALQFLNVRSLCNVIKRSAYNYLIYGLQEPLDDILKLSLVNGLEEYLVTIKAGRGISAFQVIANSVNNPALLANSGVLAIAVIIVPILAVREIQLTLGISKQGLTVSESVVASL